MTANKPQAQDGTPLGEYRFHYKDGTTLAMPIVYGEDLRDWWNTDGGKPTARGNIAWLGENWCASREGCRLRLYLGVWDNPRPDRDVLCLDYLSRADTACAPFCVAMTVEEEVSRVD